MNNKDFIYVLSLLAGQRPTNWGHHVNTLRWTETSVDRFQLHQIQSLSLSEKIIAVVDLYC